MKNCLIIALLFWTGLVSAQIKLEGRVLDSETDEPLIFATVAVYANGVLKTGTETDLEGNFSITNLVAGIYDVEFHYTGYLPLKMQNIDLIARNVIKLEAKMEVGYRSCCPICVYTPPLIYLDDTTQGRVFKSSDIKHSPFR